MKSIHKNKWHNLSVILNKKILILYKRSKFLATFIKVALLMKSIHKNKWHNLSVILKKIEKCSWHKMLLFIWLVENLF